jgi:putative hemolysin
VATLACACLFTGSVLADVGTQPGTHSKHHYDSQSDNHAGNHSDNQNNNQADSMDRIALDFVAAGLRFQNHDPLPYVYIGEAAAQEIARSDDASLDAVLEQLEALQHRIHALPAALEPQRVRRQRDLNDRLTALLTRGEILQGQYPSSFDAETRQLFGVVAPTFDEAHFRSLVRELDGIIPGDGALVDRVAAFREQFVIPPQRLEQVIGRAMDECRARTRKHIALPAEENVTLNITRDMPWVGFTEYRGDSQSIVHLNGDVPVHIERAIELGCHEGYPGHHVHATLVEQELVKRRGWQEYTYIPMVGPLAVIAEGAASYAMDLAFSREERMAFERSELLPLARLDDTQLDTYYHYIDLIDQLNYARNEVARKYLYGGMSRDAALQWLMEFGLETAGTAATRLNVIDAQRSYVVTYNHGKQLLGEYVQRNAAASGDAAWGVYKAILTTPLSPADLTVASAPTSPQQLPNPAAIFCAEQGGAYRMEQRAQGVRGICVLGDGRELDAWEYFRSSSARS